PPRPRLLSRSRSSVPALYLRDEADEPSRRGRAGDGQYDGGNACGAHRVFQNMDERQPAGSTRGGQPSTATGTVHWMHRVAASAFVVLLFASPAALAETIRSGSLRVDVGTTPFSLTFAADGGPVLSSATAAGPTGPSALSVRTPAGWIHATTVSGVV